MTETLLKRLMLLATTIAVAFALTAAPIQWPSGTGDLSIAQATDGDDAQGDDEGGDED